MTSSPNAVSSHSILSRRKVSAQMPPMAPVVCNSLGRAKGMFRRRVHTARQKNWLTQLNRAAYTEESLDEGVYNTVYNTGGFQTQVTQTPETVLMQNTWILGTRGKEKHLKYTYTRTVCLMKNCTNC